MKYAITINEQGIITGLESYQGLEGQIEIHKDDLPIILEYLEHDPNADTQRELYDIQQWLNANDYKINKHLLGEYADDDERWTTYLQERANKLARYNELEGQHIEKEPFDLTLLTPLVEVVEEVVEEVDPREDVAPEGVEPFEDREEFSLNEDEGTVGEGVGTDDATTSTDTTETEPINEEV